MEIELSAVAELVPCQSVGLPRAVAEDGGICRNDIRRVLIGYEYRRFVTSGKVARAVLVVDSGTCAGLIGAIAIREVGNNGGEADGITVVRAAIESQCIVLRAGRQSGHTRQDGDKAYVLFYYFHIVAFIKLRCFH